MIVYAIYGASGTGKSSSALSFAHEHEIDAIIDDGLLIANGKIIAGISAKFEKNTITAVRRAIFTDATHAESVKEKIKELDIESLLIIGTSKKMVNKIAEALELPTIAHYFPIEDIRSEEEILLAKYIRDINGNHTMPLPHSEVEQNFFKRLIQRGRVIFSSKKEKIGETTIVSPDFHPQTIFVDPKVYEQVIRYVAEEEPSVQAVQRILFRFTEHLPIVHIELTIKAPVTYDVWQAMYQLQIHIQQAFLQMFRIKLTTIQISVKSIQT